MNMGREGKGNDKDKVWLTWLDRWWLCALRQAMTGRGACALTHTDRKSSLGDVKLAHVFSDTQKKLSSQQPIGTSGVQQE